MPLEEFIGHGEAAVILLFQDDFSHLDIHKRGFFLGSQYKVLSHYITTKQSYGSAFISTLNPLQALGPGSNRFSVLSLAESLQDAEFPFVLQRCAATTYPSILIIDNVDDDKLITLALAISYQRFNIAHNLRDHVVIYGGHLIIDPGMHSSLQKCIDTPRDFKFLVTNESMRGDPWSGLTKSCAMYYCQDGWVKGRFVPENSSLHIERDIKNVAYDGVDVKSQVTYYNLWRALVEHELVKVTNDSLSEAPKVGPAKRCKVLYCELGGSCEVVYEAVEGKYTNFKTFRDRFAETVSKFLPMK